MSISIGHLVSRKVYKGLYMDVYNENGERVGEMDFSLAALETQINENILYQVIHMHLANRRSGTASTKTRSEVRGSGRKLFRQKGTGMARAGMRRTPVRVGGGVAFGPKPRDYSYKVPKKMKFAAIKSALIDKFQSDDVFILDSISFDRPKTKRLVNILDNLGVHSHKKVLIVLDASNWNVLYSARNIPRVNVCVWDTLNTHDILWHDKLVVTQNSLENIKKRFFSD